MRTYWKDDDVEHDEWYFCESSELPNLEVTAIDLFVPDSLDSNHDFLSFSYREQRNVTNMVRRVIAIRFTPPLVTRNSSSSDVFVIDYPLTKTN